MLFCAAAPDGEDESWRWADEWPNEIAAASAASGASAIS
jgi:hypothetical protein